jgi:hypothetical protein
MWWIGIGSRMDTNVEGIGRLVERRKQVKEKKESMNVYSSL